MAKAATAGQWRDKLKFKFALFGRVLAVPPIKVVSSLGRLESDGLSKRPRFLRLRGSSSPPLAARPWRTRQCFASQAARRWIFVARGLAAALVVLAQLAEFVLLGAEAACETAAGEGAGRHGNFYVATPELASARQAARGFLAGPGENVRSVGRGAWRDERAGSDPWKGWRVGEARNPGPEQETQRERTLAAIAKLESDKGPAPCPPRGVLRVAHAQSLERCGGQQLRPQPRGWRPQIMFAPCVAPALPGEF